MNILEFDVVGTPAPQGSKRGFYNKNLGRVQMVESSKKVAPWRQDVTAAAMNVLAETTWTAPTGPVAISIHFRLERPRYHFGTGRNADQLKPTAPEYVDKKPDLDKLVRSTLDALKASGVIRDDAQVAILALVKKYAAPGQPTGAAITITAIDTATPPNPMPALAAPPSDDPSVGMASDSVATPTALVTSGTAAVATAQEALL